MAEFADYTPLSGGNNAAPPAGAPEGQLRSDVNDIMREMMGAMRRDWEGTAADGGAWRNPVKSLTVTFSTATKVIIAGIDARPFFPVGRKVRIDDTLFASVYAFVKSVTYSSPDTTVEVEDFDPPDTQVPATTNSILFYSAFGGENAIGKAAFGTSVAADSFWVPTTRDAAGINAAITSAVANNGIVLLEAAEYTLETFVVASTGTVLWGMGETRTILKLDDAKNLDCIVGPTNSSNVTLRDLTIDGNAANQTTAGHGLRLNANHSGWLVKNVEIVDTFDDGIGVVVGNIIGLRLEGVTVRRPGGNGVRLADALGTSRDNFLSDIKIEDVGNVAGAGNVSADGLLIEGEFTAHNLQIEMNLPNGHSGAAIQLELVDTGATPSRGGSYSSLGDFRIIGTGRDVTGLKIGGSHNSIGPGVVELSGASALPIHIQGRDATDPADRNLITGVNFVGGLRCECGTFSHKTTFSGCRFDGQSGHALRFAAPDCKVKASSVQGSLANGVHVLSGAVDCSISGCSFDGVVQINVTTEAHRLDVNGCDFRGGTKAVDIRSVDECSVRSCFGYAQTGVGGGVDIDSGDNNSVVGCYFQDGPNPTVRIRETTGGAGSAVNNSCVFTMFNNCTVDIADTGTTSLITPVGTR